MLEKLIDFFFDILHLFRFWFVVDEYEQYILLTFGRYDRKEGKVYKSGIHWRMPFGIQKEIGDNVVKKVVDLPQQNITMKCGTTITVGPIIAYKISDIIKVMLDVEDAETAARDSSRATLRQDLSKITYEEALSMDREGILVDYVTKTARAKGFKFGVEIMELGLSDFAKSKVYRFVTGE